MEGNGNTDTCTAHTLYMYIIIHNNFCVVMDNIIIVMDISYTHDMLLTLLYCFSSSVRGGGKGGGGGGEGKRGKGGKTHEQ